MVMMTVMLTVIVAVIVAVIVTATVTVTVTMKRKVCTVFHAPSNDSSGSAPLTNRLIKYQSQMPAKPRMGMAKYTVSWL